MSKSDEALLVRLGVRYFRSLSEKKQLGEAIDAVHLLNPEERKALRRIERGAILRAALAGAISTIVAGAVEVTIAQPLLGKRPRHATFHDELKFYAVVGVATIVTSIVEILYLYWDGLRAVHDLSREAGLDLFPNEDDGRALAATMARAALELPNPTAVLHGVDPRREASRFRLVVASLVYKLKISVSNFLVKALVRRMLGRAFVRGWLPFVAAPITAAWNAFICWLIMREARIRAMGPSASREMLDIVFGAAPNPSADARLVVVRAVASSIVRTEDLHPNHAALLREVVSRLGSDLPANVDSTKAFLAALAPLDRDDQTLVLRVLGIASIIDGRLTRAEKRLLEEARRLTGRPPELTAVERLRRAFMAGDAIDPARVLDL